MLGCGWFGDVNGLFECAPEVNGALLDHLSDVLDPVLLVLDARRLLSVSIKGYNAAREKHLKCLLHTSLSSFSNFSFFFERWGFSFWTLNNQ